MSQQVNVLIIGQGLAGTLLAANLVARGVRVLVADDGHRSSSTRMAAGLLNPVSGLRLTKSRQAERFIPEALHTYADLEQRWGASFYHATPLLRIFRSERQRADWLKRLGSPDYAAYLQAPLAPEALPAGLHAPHGAGLQQQTGYLDTASFLDAGRHWLRQQDALHEGLFDWSELRLSGSAACWREWTVQHVIACEGYRGQDNPWFGWLPFRPCKGQILTLETGEPLPAWILNRGTWLVPLGKGRARIGATYERDAIDSGPSLAAREILLREAHALFPDRVRWSLVEEAVGVRPGTRDKMPLVGLHPEYPQLGMCNGFGSKGVLMAPYYTRCLAAALVEGAALPAEASLQRWWNPHATG
ncbi:MAG: FAD-binding oxidoreductase [Gammaproteobacteria bacterium]|nr:FAD-binding oxidoreductase [Gammaproteobacteria bacterium]